MGKEMVTVMGMGKVMIMIVVVMGIKMVAKMVTMVKMVGIMVKMVLTQHNLTHLSPNVHKHPHLVQLTVTVHLLRHIRVIIMGG